MATAADGTHPTGMHSCLVDGSRGVFFSFLQWVHQQGAPILVLQIHGRADPGFINGDGGGWEGPWRPEGRGGMFQAYDFARISKNSQKNWIKNEKGRVPEVSYVAFCEPHIAISLHQESLDSEF